MTPEFFMARCTLGTFRTDEYPKHRNPAVSFAATGGRCDRLRRAGESATLSKKGNYRRGEFGARPHDPAQGDRATGRGSMKWREKTDELFEAYQLASTSI